MTFHTFLRCKSMLLLPKSPLLNLKYQQDSRLPKRRIKNQSSMFIILYKSSSRVANMFKSDKAKSGLLLLKVLITGSQSRNYGSRELLQQLCRPGIWVASKYELMLMELCSMILNFNPYLFCFQGATVGLYRVCPVKLLSILLFRHKLTFSDN